MKTRLVRVAAQFAMLGFGISLLLSPFVLADEPVYEPNKVAADLKAARDSFKRKDVASLLALLDAASPYAKGEIAICLGRLGAREALPALRRLDAQYAGFECLPVGEFGVALILIDHEGYEPEKQALLKAVKSPLTADSVRNRAAEELLSYGDEDVLTELAPMGRCYGAQYTVLRLQCAKLSDDQAIEKCISQLETHETPMLAEAAQRVLVFYGAKAREPVKRLIDRTAKRVKPIDPKFTIEKTILTRCNSILDQIPRDER